MDTYIIEERGSQGWLAPRQRSTLQDLMIDITSRVALHGRLGRYVCVTDHHETDDETAHIFVGDLENPHGWEMRVQIQRQQFRQQSVQPVTARHGPT